MTPPGNEEMFACDWSMPRSDSWRPRFAGFRRLGVRISAGLSIRTFLPRD